MSLVVMISRVMRTVILYPGMIAAQGVAAAVILGARLPRKGLAIFTAGMLAFFLVRTAASVYDPNLDWDVEVFWYSGKAILEGRDPYAPNPTMFIALNPPSAFPIFVALAMKPFPTSSVVWSIFNLFGSIAIVPLAARALAEQAAWAGEDGPEIPPEVVLAMTTAFVFSSTCVIGLEAGQLAVLTALCILGALIAQARVRPILAGALLAVATVKVTMMLPFLLLFLRRRDWKTWAALVVVGLGLSLATQSPAQFLARMRTYVHLLASHNAPGAFNDYGFEGPNPESIIAVDHTLYRLGMRDRGVIAVTQLVILLALGAAVAREALLRPETSRMTAVSFVALFADLFLYHRYYDLILLTIPLVYTATRARSTTGPPHVLYAVSAIAILIACNLVRYPLAKLLDLSFRLPAPWGWLIQAVMLPYVFWAVCISLACLWLAERSGRATA
jgi:hypothetical protein